MSKLMHVTDGRIGEILAEENGKIKLLVDGEEKLFSASTVKRYWKPIVEEQVEETPAPTQETPAPAQTIISNTLVISIKDYALSKGCTIKETKSYVGLQFKGKTIAEVHESKKGDKVTVYFSKKGLTEDFVANYKHNKNSLIIKNGSEDTYQTIINEVVRVRQ